MEYIEKNSPDDSFVTNNDQVEEQRALSFGQVAEEYDRYRPTFPRFGEEGERVKDLLGEMNGLDVLEIGAGSGLITRYLLSVYPKMNTLTVVEPDLDMLKVLKERVKEEFQLEDEKDKDIGNRRETEIDNDTRGKNDKEERESQSSSSSLSFKVLINRSENIQLPDESVDVILMVSTWHWLDKEATTKEICRLLRPGGKLLILWNSFYGEDKYPWLKQMVKVRDNPELLLEALHARQVSLSCSSSTLSSSFPDSPDSPSSSISYSGKSDNGLRHRIHHEAHFDPAWEASLTNIQQVDLEYKWKRSIQEVISLFRTYSGSITKSTEEMRQVMDEFVRQTLYTYAERCEEPFEGKKEENKIERKLEDDEDDDDKLVSEKNESQTQIIDDNTMIFFPMNLRGTIAIRK